MIIVPVLDKELVEVEEWGGAVWVRVLTGTERDRFEVQVSDSKRTNFRARLAVYCVCDENGQRLFAESDVQALGNQPGSALEKVCTVALRLNRYTSEDVALLEKNSESVTSNGSA